jgi:predicted esterase
MTKVAARLAAVVLAAAGCGGGTSAQLDAAAAAPMPEARFIPRPAGPCPDFVEGTVPFMPAGGARNVQIWISDAARAKDGPLVFYWHGTGGTPMQAEAGLGTATIAAIKALGGIVAAPVHDPAAGVWPWYLVAGTQELDLAVADEVLACAIEKVGVDLRHIHSVGFSAGAIHTVQMGYRRSGYLASVVTYSGGQQAAIPDQDPVNKFAAMIFHGGPTDQVIVSFQMVSERYQSEMATAGRFAFICNHNMGHRIPTEALPSVWRFLQDYPFGVNPSPYAAGLPPGFPAYCQPPM